MLDKGNGLPYNDPTFNEQDSIMTTEERKALIEKLAQKVTYDADMDSVIEFFYNAQYDYFNDMTDEGLQFEALKCIRRYSIKNP